MVSDKQATTLGPWIGPSDFLIYNSIVTKLIKTFIVTNRKPFMFCVLVMATINDDWEIRIDGNPNQIPLENQR